MGCMMKVAPTDAPKAARYANHSGCASSAPSSFRRCSSTSSSFDCSSCSFASDVSASMFASCSDPSSASFVRSFLNKSFAACKPLPSSPCFKSILLKLPFNVSACLSNASSFNFRSSLCFSKAASSLSKALIFSCTSLSCFFFISMIPLTASRCFAIWFTFFSVSAFELRRSFRSSSTFCKPRLLKIRERWSCPSCSSCSRVGTCTGGVESTAPPDEPNEAHAGAPSANNVATTPQHMMLKRGRGKPAMAAFPLSCGCRWLVPKRQTLNGAVSSDARCC
mmetsp:Transcript_73849/g.142825  ORF Transcript_73849/g.142825 Transcript_73849/m.142825 type:complete len:279 (-) Transcript_73849:300-1136(-)